MNNPQSGSTPRRALTRRGVIVHRSGEKFRILYQLITPREGVWRRPPTPRVPVRQQEWNGTRMKVLVYDGFGPWLAARRPNRSRFPCAEGASAYMKNALERLPTLPASRISDLLPHRWAPY